MRDMTQDEEEERYMRGFENRRHLGKLNDDTEQVATFMVPSRKLDMENR